MQDHVKIRKNERQETGFQQTKLTGLFAYKTLKANEIAALKATQRTSTPE